MNCIFNIMTTNETTIMSWYSRKCSALVSSRCLAANHRHSLTCWGPWYFQMWLHCSSLGSQDNSFKDQNAQRTENVPKDERAQIILSALVVGWGGGMLTMELMMFLGTQMQKRSKFQLPSGRTMSLSEHWEMKLKWARILLINGPIFGIQLSS